MKIYHDSAWRTIAILSCLVMLSSCSTPGLSSLPSLPLFKVTVKAVDEADAPVAGALVESAGQKVTTGADGTAELKFGSLGVHAITVIAQDRAPASLSVTMPLDMGKTMPVRLGKPIAIGANINVSANVNVGGYMAGMMTAIYPMIFQSMFTAYGYNMELFPYKQGEWTEWNFNSSQKHEMVMRKAFLIKQDNNQEWWQVQWTGDRKNEKFVFEVLFSPDRQSIRRMRQQSGEGQASEVPVTEGWYSAPMQLTPESVEGAVVKKGVEVTVPAGAFKADLIEFATMGSEGTVRMWRVKNVPGGVARVEISHGKKAEWVTELKGYGSDAKSLLGSY